MNNEETTRSMPVLDETSCHRIAAAIKPVKLPSHRKEAMRTRILDQIDQDQQPQQDLLLTIRQNEGNWIKIAPKIEKKQLFIDREKGIESYLLKIKPGVEVPAHQHADDEYCLVLEGSVDFDDIHLKAGDYHVARKGSLHGKAYSQEGALLYLQCGLAEQSNI